MVYIAYQLELNDNFKLVSNLITQVKGEGSFTEVMGEMVSWTISSLQSKNYW